ncbi:Na+/H+ antiporter NhaA [Herbidospora cretacea]|uniref:Na+/H+ antiporter NhaA n=1 Tax=Herbidospora cretacea TaxID=28444 RepID=UPI0007C70E32|nr:Na+/H+ antiporter NhaA [Herbidospora cretacea]
MPNATRGWAIPTATDIAFVLAVLAVTASALPMALRPFPLTLAVLDDLGAIGGKPSFLPLPAAVVVLAVFGLLQPRRVRSAFLYVLLGVAAWVLLHESGIHPTVAGVACGLLMNVDGDPSPATRADHVSRPISAGFAVPVFAFLAAGVPLDLSALGGVFTDRIALGVLLGLVVGKFGGVVGGVFGGAWLSVRLGFARISPDLVWRDIVAVSVLAGVGFTVSLLIGDRAFQGDTRATTAVLMASVIASLLAAPLLRIRVRTRARDDI